MRSLLSCLLLGFLGLVRALSASGNKLLVVLEDEGEKSKYSQFCADLQARDFQITYRTPKDPSLSLFAHGVPAYSHLLLLPPKSKGLGPALTPNLLVDFVDGGSNVLLALSGENAIPSAISSLLLELDIALPPERTSLVLDHFNHDTRTAAETHDVLVLNAPELARRDVKNFFAVDGSLAFPRAVGQVLDNASPLLSPILRAPSTAYTTTKTGADEEGDTEPFATGSQIALVSAFQARNSARFTVLGSAEALENNWFGASVSLPGGKSKPSKTANRAFAQKLSGWTFQETGVLRVGQVRHHLHEEDEQNKDGTQTQQRTVPGNVSNDVTSDANPAIYRIKNKVHYSIPVSEWSTTHWTPFTPPSSDAVQLEFSMLSPFHRLNLTSTTQTPNATLFTTSLTLPDQHGIFNFLVEYRRPFYSNVEVKDTVTVRHFAHDEYPRSFVISGAWPWIGGIWVTVAGWLGFVAVWLYSKPVTTRRDLKARIGGR